MILIYMSVNYEIICCKINYFDLNDIDYIIQIMNLKKCDICKQKYKQLITYLFTKNLYNMCIS